MTAKKTTRKRKPRKKTSKKKQFRQSLFKALVGLTVLAIVVAGAIFLSQVLIPPQRSEPPAKHYAKTPVQKKKPVKKVPVFEVYLEKAAPSKIPAKPEPPAVTPPPVKPAPSEGLPRVAIIIDDIGYDKRIANKFIGLAIPLTLSILPHSPHQSKIARRAHEKGLETMLHLPMEPEEYPKVNPGPGTLLTSMSPDELIDQLQKNLAQVPYVNGVNNHMGSKLTAESDQMYQIFTVLKKRGLFFIDSRTTKDTICKSSARLFKIPFAQRDVFLDHSYDPNFIRGQIQELIRIAQRQGSAIAIGHPHPTTYKILKEELSNLQQKVRLVPASELVETIG